jgi:hypothetical protein
LSATMEALISAFRDMVLLQVECLKVHSQSLIQP